MSSVTAIIHDSGRQFCVSPGSVIDIGRLGLEPGSDIVFDDVRLITGEAGTTIGRPRIAGARVTAKVEGQYTGRKVVSFKYRRRTNSTKWRKGHRQRYTRVRITGVEGA